MFQVVLGLAQHLHSFLLNLPTLRGTCGNFEEGEVGKVAYWSKKAAIYLKCVKIEEKILWGRV